MGPVPDIEIANSEETDAHGASKSPFTHRERLPFLLKMKPVCSTLNSRGGPIPQNKRVRTSHIKYVSSFAGTLS